MEFVPDSTVLAQKILSCVARVEERFGAGHVADVLLGANTEMIRKCRHAQLSTYGLIKEMDKKELTNLIYQMVDSGLLERTPGDRPILKLNETSWRVLRKQEVVRLLRSKAEGVKKTKVEEVSWEGVDKGLFEELRKLRREFATQEGVSAFVIFSDATLRELARVRPSSLELLGEIEGVGGRRRDSFGRDFLALIIAYCREQGLSLDQAAPGRPQSERRIPQASRAAFEMFAKGALIESVMATLDRARSTTCQYLVDYIRAKRPASIDRWVAPQTYKMVTEKAAKMEDGRLKPIYEALGGKVSYDEIKLVMTHLAVS
jgi:ATP-dependent DNA helicase RecQ